MMPEAKKDNWSYITIDFLNYYYIKSYIYDPCYSLACGHKRISGRRFSPPELAMGGFMLLMVYTKIYATYKGNRCERTFLLSGICSIHTAKEPANVLKKFNAAAKIS